MNDERKSKLQALKERKKQKFQSEISALIPDPIPGEDGERGEKGEQGEKGIQGERGLTGPQGLQGKTGQRGPIGLTGKQGIQGKAGADGKSIVWKKSWKPSTNYVINDAVEHDGSSFICIKDHKSRNINEPDLGTEWPMHWNVIARKGAKGQDGANYGGGGSGSSGGGAVSSVNGKVGAVVLTQDDVLDGGTYKQYSDTEKTKLSGIEAGADVTDATNVAAAGAFMKSIDDTDDITEGSSNKFFTDERVDDRVSSLLTEGKAIDLDYVDASDKLTITGHSNQIIYNSSGGTGFLRFNDWAKVITYLALTGADTDIIVEQDETIPSGNYDLKRARFVGNNGLEYTSGGWTVTFGDNTTISAWETPSNRSVRLLSTSTTGNIFTTSNPKVVNCTAVSHIHSATYPFFKFTGSGQFIVALNENARWTKYSGGVENVDCTSSAYSAQLILARGTGSAPAANTFKSTNSQIFVDVLGSAAQDPTSFPLSNSGLAGGSVVVSLNQVYATTLTHATATKSADYSYTRVAEIYVVSASGAERTGSLPAATGSGVIYTTFKSDTSTNNVVIDADGTDTVDGAGSLRLRKQYDTVSLVDYATGTWKVIADTRKKVIGAGVSTVGNVGTGEDDLQSVVVPPYTLLNNGDSLKIEAQYTIANNANQKRVKLFFGSATLFDTGGTGIATGVSYAINLEVRVYKDGSNTQRFTINYTATPSSGSAILGTGYGTATQTDTSTITIKCTGETNAASDNDVTNPVLFVKHDPI